MKYLVCCATLQHCREYFDYLKKIAPLTNPCAFDYPSLEAEVGYNHYKVTTKIPKGEKFDIAIYEESEDFDPMTLYYCVEYPPQPLNKDFFENIKKI